LALFVSTIYVRRAYQNRPEFYHSKIGRTRKNTILLIKINNAPILKSGIFPSLKHGDFTLVELGDKIVQKRKIQAFVMLRRVSDFKVSLRGKQFKKTGSQG